MKSSGKVLLIIVAIAFSGYATQTLLSESPPVTSDYRDDCVVDERSDCVERCQTEHNCCIKACNYVEPKAKYKCLQHCEGIFRNCKQKCDEQPAADEATESPGA